MTITVVESFAGAANAGAVNNVSFAETLLEGDLVFVAQNKDIGTWSGPTGYTNLYGPESNSPNCIGSYKLMGATPDTGFTIPTGFGATYAFAYVVLRGVDVDNIFDVASTNATTGSGGNVNFPARTTATDGAYVVLVGNVDEQSGSVTLFPANFTDFQREAGSGGGAGGSSSIFLVGGVFETAGAIDFSANPDGSFDVSEQTRGYAVVFRDGNYLAPGEVGPVPTDCREPVEIIEIITPKCVNTHGSAPCTATETGDDKCFNTRAGCNDVDNFQARPAAHLVPDTIYRQLDNVDGASEITVDADFFLRAEVSFGSSPDGCIFEIGTSADGAYLGVTSGNLIWRAGDGGPSATGGANTGRIAVNSADFAGMTLTLLAEIQFTASGSCTMNLWAFDPVSFTLSLLGTDTYTDNATRWAADFALGGVGKVVGTFPTGEDDSDFNGVISSLSVYNSQAAPTLSTTSEAYRQRYFFDDGRKAKPSDTLYILPALSSASSVGTRLNLTGSDGRYEPLGRRAFMSLKLANFTHTDFPYDPYLADRTYEPLDRGTFWAKWLQRNKFGKTRAIVRRYTGYDGQALSAMRSQTYILDRFTFSGEAVQIECRDVLALTEFRRAQVPAPSNGKLSAVLTDVATSMTLTGDVTEEYPASGTVRIDDELITYSGVSYASSPDETTFSGLTRGTDGSTAGEHDVDENVQTCRRYTAARIDTVLEELIVDDAEVPAQLANLADFTTVYDTSLSAYTLTTLISEPTGVDQLIGEIAEQCSFYIWWDERSQLIEMDAIEALTSVATTFTQDNNIIDGTFKIEERPKERLTTISYYYNPRDFAGDLDKPSNYKNQLIVSNATASGPDKYGKLPQTREVFSRWLTTEAQANQTGSRFSVRYAEVPRYATFMVDAKDREYWVGDFATLTHDYLLDGTGALDEGTRWLIIEAEEVEAGHMQRLTLVDVTLDGLIYYITENSVSTYTAELFAAQNAFITDNNGLNPDGTLGAQIS